MVEDSTSLQHDYCNVMESTIENYPKVIPYETLGSLPQTVITSYHSPSALMHFEGLHLELLNQTATDQASSKNLKATLFQVKKMVSKKQELSFKEKFHLPEENILRPCNLILPNVA